MTQNQLQYFESTLGVALIQTYLVFARTIWHCPLTWHVLYQHRRTQNIQKKPPRIRTNLLTGQNNTIFSNSIRLLLPSTAHFSTGSAPIVFSGPSFCMCNFISCWITSGTPRDTSPRDPFERDGQARTHQARYTYGQQTCVAFSQIFLRVFIQVWNGSVFGDIRPTMAELCPKSVYLV